MAEEWKQSNSAEAHKPLLLRTARTYCKGAGAALTDRGAAGLKITDNNGGTFRNGNK